ncbi:MAG TPA: hydroxymyristoyl-ACP dehydratase [Flavobacteriaceae bacterium]|nr:hydroxymyristoyl-ACP dehydratase [Flavobacteriaceae bacterium]
MKSSEIISKLPYSEPFLFVDEIESVSEKDIQGNYTFRKNAFFYQGHFKNNPITPGVILTECMAQIGVVSFGIYLLGVSSASTPDNAKIALTSTKIEFYEPVFPEEKVTVVSEKIYFRFHKLKCSVKMYNKQRKLVCKGEISGMIV